MNSEDVKPSISKALLKTGLTKNTAPVLLSDSSPCYIFSEIKSFFHNLGIKRINGKPCHPQTQGKIELYHRTMKNVVKLDNYYSPKKLEQAVADFVNHYNNHRYHESINNLTPADVYFGRGEKILTKRKRIKKITIKKRKQLYLKNKLMKSVAV